MAKKAPLFMGTVVAAMAAVGVVALSTCANNKKTPEHAATIADNGVQPAPPTVATRPPKMDERLTPIIADLVAKFEQHEGITATVKTEMAQAAEGDGSTVGNGVYDCKKRDGKLLIHFWITNTLHLFTETKNYMTGEILDDLYDGEFLYKRLQQPKYKKLLKRHYSPDTILQIGGRPLFRSLAERYDLKLLADAEVNGSPTYAIEASPLSGVWTTKHYFDKQSGIRTKLEEINEKGEKALALELSEIKLNPEFGPTAFTPTMPRDFTFIDETTNPEPQP